MKRSLAVQHKIILMIYMIVFPVLILTSGIIIYGSYTASRNEAINQYRSVLNTVQSSVDAIERDVRDISIYFSINEDVYDLLNADATESISVDPLFWNNFTPREIILDMLAIKSHMLTVILYPENGLTPFYVSHDASVHDMDIGNIRRLPIYERTVAARGDNVFSRVNAGEQGLFLINRSDKIVFTRELFDLSKRKRLGFLGISVAVGWYERICRNALVHGNEAIMILSADGTEVARTGNISDEVAARLQSREFYGSDNSAPPRMEEWYIFFLPSADGQKDIYYLAHAENWSQWVTRGLALPVALALALLICLWPISVLASRIIARPLRKLHASMQKFKEGDFFQQVENDGSDEIAELSREFNRMVDDLRELIDRNYVMALRERESELNALAAQINPHFLYNALDSLYWQASDFGADKLAEDILAMSELFRLLLSSGDSDVFVERELAIITRYLHIQKMRFSRKFDYEVDVDEELLKQKIPKLILQPFVENAIVHGLERKDTWGYVKVFGKIENERMVFTIEDSGTGMSRETLEGIFEQNASSNRIGRFAIRNVKERIALKYNSDGVLEIDSELGVGSRVRISLPLNEAGDSQDEDGGESIARD